MPVEGEISFIEIFCMQVFDIRAVGRQIEDGTVQEPDFLPVQNGKPESFSRRIECLSGGSEEEIHIRGDTDFFQVS